MIVPKSAIRVDEERRKGGEKEGRREGRREGKGREERGGIEEVRASAGAAGDQPSLWRACMLVLVLLLVLVTVHFCGHV
jgi:hypothetical protein